MPTGLGKKVVKRSTDCGETPSYDSKVIAPRNPKLIKEIETPEVKFSPSIFMKEMAQTTEEKLSNTHEMRLPRIIELLDMGDTTHQKFTQLDVDEPMFQPFPSDITFQQYEPCEVYEVPLLLRNNDKVPRLIKVYQTDSPYFKVISPPNVGHKVAPGCASIFKIQFTPEEKKDYTHELICMTEKEKFIIPVRCIGARALLDFPDDVNFATCPVKYPSSRTLLVRNVGNKEARFALSTEKPFTVNPPNGILASNESMQIEIVFQPMKIGSHFGELVLHYDSGENIFVNLYGGAIDSNVRLDKNSLRIENTYISMANQRTVTISNRSDVIVHYQWKPFATQEEEDQQKQRFCQDLGAEEEMERDRFLEECITDPTLRDKMSLLTRTFKNRRRLVAGDSMLFSDDVFTIEPVEGDIWPNTSAEVEVIFQPQEARAYQCTAFCDITGRESRLPLRIRGDGIGPNIHLAFDELDMGNIFVGSTHSYEVVMTNRGDIDAIYNLNSTVSTFGPKFSFNPSEGIVLPGGHQAIQINFCSPLLGDFNEDFYFTVDGSPHRLKLNFKGCVIGPTFHFDIPKLKFGSVSYGFKSTQCTTLFNTSLVPMTFHLRVPGDGTGDVVNAAIDDTLNKTLGIAPSKEFTLIPSTGTIDPQSQVEIKVELISNTIKKYDMSVVVDIDGVGEEILSLPISAKCVVPAIAVVTPILDYKRCFLNHPYEQNVQLYNDSDLPAKYDLLPQEVDDLSPILYNSPVPSGIIAPHSVVEVPVVITPQALEELDINSFFKIFGSIEPPMHVQLSCVGEGPVVHVSPTDIDYGNTQVLTDISRTVILSNESLIPAHFTCQMVRSNSVWKVEPKEGIIPPEDSLALTVTCNLDDCIRFQDKLAINFINSQVRMISVMAHGQGTTIVSEPPLTPAVDLGPHFSNKPCVRIFKLTNSGRRHQQMFWSTEGFLPQKNRKLPSINAKDIKYQRLPKPPQTPRPVFSLTPSRFELEPGQSIDVLLEGFSDTPKVVKERMVCHAIIGRASGKERIMKTDINVEFITPLLEFSTKQIAFRVEKGPDDVLEKQQGELELHNVSSLPLSTMLVLEYPFQIVTEDGTEVSEMELNMELDQKTLIKITFDPDYQEDNYTRTADVLLKVSYKEHPHVDYINLIGEVFFPNLTFEKMDVDFGCILNDTEVTRYVNIANNSPMPVKYQWSFLEPEEEIVIYPKGGGDADVESDQELADNEEVDVQIDDADEADEEEDEQEAEKDEEKPEEETTETHPEEKKVNETEQKHVVIDSDKKDDDEDEDDNQEKQDETKEEMQDRGKKEAGADGILKGRNASMVVIDETTLPTRASASKEDSDTVGISKLPWLQGINEPTTCGIEEVFDILPLYGMLLPGENERITFTFYGHADIGIGAKAICDVEGGPRYELSLTGEASLVQYTFDTNDIDYGKQMYDEVAEAEIILENTGKVGFDFVALNMDPSTQDKPMPGIPIMIPHSGHIEAHSAQRLVIKFLPGVPEKFHKSFEIQVAHFEPDIINIRGEGVFPRVSLDLPRYADEEGHYTSLMKETKERLGTDTQKPDKEDRLPSSGSPTPRDAVDDTKSIASVQNEFPSELEMQMEVERMIVKEFASEHQIDLMMSRADSIAANTAADAQLNEPSSRIPTSHSSKTKKMKKPKCRLPDYCLDFGYVVLGTVRTHIVRATNTGYFPVSFSVDRHSLLSTGFNVELDRVRNLPGFPDQETVDFVVSFDPRGANLGLGDIETLVPINIVNGPCVFIRLKANVTMPDMEISTDTLDFATVLCGQCKVITVQLHNHKHVRCEWSSKPTDKEKRKIDKHIPLHVRKKMKPEKPKPRNFEMMPPDGFLLPGQRVNVQVKFMPTEEKLYCERLAIRLAQSSQRILLMVNGQGQEPKLEFSTSLLEFGPILPHSQGDEVEVTVKNPSEHPVEFYSLEFDTQYLEEEKILRMMKGYDDNNTILLPPRPAGHKLPSELVDFYAEQQKKQEEEEKERNEAAAAAIAAQQTAENEEGAEDGVAQSEDQAAAIVTTGPSPRPPSSIHDSEKDRRSEKASADKSERSHKDVEMSETEKPTETKDDEEDGKDKKDSASNVGVGELEITPVSAAIARHLGIDLTPEGSAARNRRGIAICVQGAPMSGKTTTAIALAKYYNTALLTVDGVVLEAISNGASSAGLRARELCSQAAKAQLLKEGEGSDAEAKAAGAGGLSVEAVAAHAAQGGGSVVSFRAESQLAVSRHSRLAQGHKPAHSTIGSKADGEDSKPEKKDKKEKKADTDNTTQLSGSPPPAAPIARRLSVSASVAGEEGLMSCILPEDLLVEILAERLQLNDCHRGVVFDGLETMFSQSLLTATHVLLKAFNNRKHLFFITLKLEQSVLQAREKKAREERERQAKLEEEEEKRALEEMSEDEYDSLSDEQKADVDMKRLKSKKERLKREQEERLERERRERELRQLEEERRQEEEKAKHKKGHKGREKEKEKEGKGGPPGAKSKDAKVGGTGSKDVVKQGDKHKDKERDKDKDRDRDREASDHGLKAAQSAVTDRPESHGTAGSESFVDELTKRRKSKKDEKGRPISTEVASKEAIGDGEPERDPAKEAEIMLTNRFRAFEHCYKDIEKLLNRWDRNQGITVPDPTADASDVDEQQIPVHPPSGKKLKGRDKEKERERLERERMERERIEKERAEKEKQAAAAAAAESQDGTEAPEGTDNEEKKQEEPKNEVGIANIIMDVAELEMTLGQQILDTNRLPSAVEVLDGLGLGPSGPPVPPPANFSVVPYPVKRKPPPGGEVSAHYLFVASSPDDPNIGQEEKPKEVEPEPEAATPDKGRDKDDHPTPTGKGKGKDKLRAGAESQSGRRKSAGKGRSRKGSLTVTSPPPGTTTPMSDADGQSSTAGETAALQEPKNPRLSIFRWMLQANSEVILRIRFQSEELGQFDQTLNFEIVGTRRRYQLYCRGICAFPNISREPRIVFPHRKKSRKTDEIVHKKFILNNETLEFGPLLNGKSRERYKEGKYPENLETMTVLNTSPLEADISFCFQNDSQAETWLLDPPNMLLKPGQSQELTVWAYPKNKGFFEDQIVCCIRENPEPVLFKVSCYGVRPELELDKKTLHFERVLLHRKDTKTIYLRNSTLLPVAWKVNGLENLGDDFSMPQEQGIIEPKSEYPLQAHFRAMKPINLKKIIRLEVSDVDNIVGLLHSENVQVQAEAYDVALDMSFPRGADGGLDFGIIRVMDETKQTCSIKNKGKYEIQYAFQFDQTEDMKDVSPLFSVLPQKGTLINSDRPTQVQVIFRSREEITIRDQPVLKCQVIEPNITDGGETIASIPVKLSVRAVFSKYTISPVNDINFGSMLLNQRRTRTFTIENKGEFDFKYTISKMIKDVPIQTQQQKGRMQVPGRRSRSRDGSSSGRSIARPRRAESIRQEMGGGGGGANQTRLMLGPFTVYPAFGLVMPGAQQIITVDCGPEAVNKFEEDICIDISDRDPKDHPQGIPYKLISESCVPGIDTNDVGAIFEEHRVCKNLSVFLNNHTLELDSGGVFGEDENKFVFGNVIVGRKAKARFKIINNNKVPCDVVFTCKPVSSKPSSKLQDIFEIEPNRVSIPAHSHTYATVKFTPPSMQTYTAYFEAAIDGLSGALAKQRNLAFEVQGEGNLPRIVIKKPTIRNKKGNNLLLFQRILIGRNQILPLILKNEGTLPSKVDIDLESLDGAFTLKNCKDTQLIYPIIDEDEDDEDDYFSEKRPHTASLIVDVGEEAKFDVTFVANGTERSEGTIKISVQDNQYEDTMIQLVGEGYEDDITLDNIHGCINNENIEALLSQEEVSAAPSNLINFGDCHIGEPRTLSFTMTNHSKADIVRFQWPEHPECKFSPMIGHLYPASAKDMTITFKTDVPKTIEEAIISCKVTKITFDLPPNQLNDWDDRMRVVKWIDVPTQPARQQVSAEAASRPKSNSELKKEERESKRDHKKQAELEKERERERERERLEEEMRKKAMEPVQTPRPAKRKVVETEPEPEFTAVEDTARDIDLIVSANADYSKYKCKTDSVHFKDTLMFQTRVYQFQLNNKGNVQLDYNWQVILEDSRKSVSFADEDNLRLTTPRSFSAVTDIPEIIPFSIEPDVGTVAVGKKQNFTVKFSPIDVHEFEGRLICRIHNLEEGKQGPVILVRGRSLMPYCHFELEDSDYITGARRNPALPGPKGAPPGSTLDANTRVIEFSSVGINVKNSRQFFIVNPTQANYSFIWSCDDEEDAKNPTVFHCGAPGGLINSGKKHLVSFAYIPNQLGIVESFWRFSIPEQNISVPFLLVGNTREPAISTDRSHINFKSLLLGHRARETVCLINNESLAFEYEILESSCHSEGFASHLDVTPLKAIVPPNSRLPIDIYFAPVVEKEVNFNLEINIQRKTLPIYLNVKAEGYSMNAALLCEDSFGKKVELTSKGLNEINFAEVEMNEKAVRQLWIVNSGRFNFDFEWTLNERSGRREKMMSITPGLGGVSHNDRKKCTLSFKPPGKVTLRGCELSLKITNGPIYNINVTGYGVAPGLHFSFTKYDFGPCFIYRAGMPEHKALLKVTNRDNKDISLDCHYTSTTYLDVQFEATVLEADKSIDIPFTFYPRESIKYHEIIPFEINGLSRTNIEVFGEGTEMRVEVVNPRDKTVNFGALRVGQTMKRVVPLINNSPCPITFKIVITPMSSSLQQLPSVLTLSNTDKITLKPRGGTHNLEVIFSPKCRIPKFTEEVILECESLSQPVFVVSGLCQGIDINLDQDSIPYGAVVLKSSSSRRLLMHNTGDIGAGFKWNAQKFGPDFSITPTKGYISSGMTVSFEVSFHPTEICQDIRYDMLRCEIEGGKPLKLVLTGMCVPCQPQKEVLHFNTHVRMKETKNLTLTNRTNQLWNLRPLIDGEYWAGADAITIEPQQSKAYEIVYRPLTMTKEGKKHTGTVFFALPDGSGLLYNLTGVSEAPKAAGSVTREVPCKTQYTELLSISNWLRKPQRFRVEIEHIKPDKLDQASIMKGLEYIDVPGLAKKDYKLNFHAHKEGTYLSKITFMNKDTEEFQFYFVTFKATPPGVIGSIEMSTPVRLSTSYTVKIDNPLGFQVTFITNCTIPEVMLPAQFLVPAQSEGKLNIEYLPLKVGETTGKLQLTSNELGLYQYDMSLCATAAGPEKALYFRSALGGHQQVSAKLINFAKVKTELVCKVDSNEFHTDKTVPVVRASSGGTEFNVDVTFEPSKLGETRATLTVCSPQAGDYIIPLFGTCIAPKPQGPYTIKAGSSTSIPFRNVFSHTTAFTFQVDNASFTCKPGENIRGKKTHNIIVGFEGNSDSSKAPKMGKLVVTCPRSAGGAANVAWTFYLKGITL
uniref:Hydrocephalus-inducing protein homolog n=1 Tax=Saccoglossus kowalevskii TaxID=10224 RepID=A0ABM0MTF8_SACKO|nr:PREDICTED: hydrocephalus-inducing protein homolog [Saccoglossus kowalevskii]